MRPLTDLTPKPLLAVGGKCLIEWHIVKLAACGVRDIVINTSWLAECFEPALGDGSRWNVSLHYSYEGPEPLETGGGMLQALKIIGDEKETAITLQPDLTLEKVIGLFFLSSRWVDSCRSLYFNARWIAWGSFTNDCSRFCRSRTIFRS